jgi:uncharacterized lipoprotein YddW (UPF0748 family)
MSRRLLVPFVAVLGLILAAASRPRAAGPASEEARALWVVRDSLTSPASIARLVEDARRSGFNTLLVQVRGRGDAYYRSSLEPRAHTLAGQPASFDPLAATLEAARAAGLAVHAWVNVNLVASAQTLPSAREHIVNRHPEWLMVPRALAQELSATATTGPGYVGKLARWTRAQSDAVEGLYASPLVAEAADHVVSVVEDLVRRYDIDGVHLDYVRYPGAEFDYSRAALRAFRDLMAPLVPSPDRARLDARARDDVLAWVDAYPDAWAAFRRTRLTALVLRLARVVREARPAAVLSAAVVPEADVAASTRFQEWPLWAANGLLDVVCPMAYTTDPGAFAAQVEQAIRLATPARVWAGIGAYRLAPAETVARIETARLAGADGIVLFSYDTMAAAPDRVDYLDIVRRSAFGTAGAGGAGGR